MKRWMSLLPLLAISGCGGEQSALLPHGEGAAEIARLSWLLFFICAVIFLIVMAATWFAIRGGKQSREWLAGGRVVVLGGIAFPVVVLTFLLGYSVWMMRADALGNSGEPALRIHVSGEQWWWRISYERPGGTQIQSANEIRIPVGADVEFVLTAPDVIHSLWIPSLGGKVDMIPGRTTRMRAHAIRAGAYRGQCAEYCGGPHAFMSLSVIAMPQAEFDLWMKSESAEAPPPKTSAETDGAKLFQAAGCGACHAVRGTEAKGVLGPDLTHFGSRRAIAAETLPMSEDNIMRFIADGQQLKPGNKMPPYKIFSRDELKLLTAYLRGLR